MGVAYSVGEVDHHYTFFVQWSHKMNTKDKKKARRPCRYVVGDKNNNRYLVLEKDKVNAINKLLIKNDSPAANNWQSMLGSVPPQLRKIIPTLYMDILPPASLGVCLSFLEKGNLLAYEGAEPTYIPLTRIRSGQECANLSGTMRATLENVRVLYFATNCTEPYVQIITVQDSKRRQSVCSSQGSEVGESDDDLLPILCDHSDLLEDQHLERIAVHMPARTKGYKWQLAYSTVVHGTSLKTLYRNMSGLDKPVMLVVKDMQNKVFGAFSTEPFRVSGSCYGTGETFLYSFSPDFKVYRWTGENSYFVRGHLDSLQIGGGGGGFGLWLDADLYRGASHSCHTFHNPPLSTQQDFLVQDLEVWTLQN